MPRMDYEKAGADIASKFGKMKIADDDKSSVDAGPDEAAKGEGDGSDLGQLGKTALAAMKAGDGEAFAEAVCRIVESHGKY